ncbi:MAG: GNAT family N-acetyltransferase [Aquificaceae bacterium]|jgi:hypothetical protein|uniref:GNAT family N-acetyltransferase n=1 Tax=Hydrogenobacter sp. Uz 6-8 TaxID=3384828 RepID=UPI0030976942
MGKHVIIREYKHGDEVRILNLFHEVFGKDLPIELWKWKYMNHGLGTFVTVAEEGDAIIGHYGLVPRRVKFEKLEGLSAVVSDVMVHSSKRGAFTKRGIFFRLVEQSIIKFCPNSDERKIILPYGFPTIRARDIGVRLGLYEEVENSTEVEFIYGNGLLKFIYSVRKCTLTEEFIEPLWDVMKKEMYDLIINYRDYRTLAWRYSQPGAKFSFYCTFKFLSPVSFLVVREDTEVKKIYDYVGSIKYLSESLNAVAKLYNTPLNMRFMPWALDKLRGLKILKVIDGPTLVANAVTGPRAEELKGKFFYTYGDEDV